MDDPENGHKCPKCGLRWGVLSCWNADKACSRSDLHCPNCADDKMFHVWRYSDFDSFDMWVLDARKKAKNAER